MKVLLQDEEVGKQRGPRYNTVTMTQDDELHDKLNTVRAHPRGNDLKDSKDITKDSVKGETETSSQLVLVECKGTRRRRRRNPFFRERSETNVAPSNVIFYGQVGHPTFTQGADYS